MAHLRVTTPAGGVRTIPLGQQPLSIGRHAGSDIRINHPYVSRQHALIRPTTGGYEVVDASANGTLVNGRSISGCRRLRPGDRLWLGGVSLEFTTDPGETSH